MNSIKMLDLAHAVYDRFLQTDGEQRIEERRRGEVTQGPAPERDSFQARMAQGALRLIGIDQTSPEAGNDQSGVPAHTINPNPSIRV